MDYFVSNLPSFLLLATLLFIAHILWSALSRDVTHEKAFLRACEKLFMIPQYINPGLSRLVCDTVPGTRIRGVKSSDYIYEAAARFAKDHGVALSAVYLFGARHFRGVGTRYEEAELRHSQIKQQKQ